MMIILTPYGIVPAFVIVCIVTGSEVQCAVWQVGSATNRSLSRHSGVMTAQCASVSPENSPPVDNFEREPFHVAKIDLDVKINFGHMEWFTFKVVNRWTVLRTDTGTLCCHHPWVTWQAPISCTAHLSHSTLYLWACNYAYNYKSRHNPIWRQYYHHHLNNKRV